MPPTTPPTDARTALDFADWLAAFDESLAGRDTDPAVGPATPPSPKARRVSETLERLETIWPRWAGNAPTPSFDEIARLRDDELRGRRFGRFVIEREMGRGGHGVVFLATDPALKRKVALKVPRPDVLVTADLRRRFVREAQAAAVLDHPNIVPIYETGETGPACYLAAAYCNGPTLGDWMQRRSSAIPPRHAALIALRMAEALQHAHDRQIFHRDVKPSNILLEPRLLHPFQNGDEGLPFTPKLTDFGLAKVVEEGCGDDTRTGAILGTPRYMAPEQAEGRLKDVGPATDVHGVGVTLYEMLAGGPPFLGAGDGETLHLVRTAEPTPPSKHRDGIPRDLEAICLKCLEKEIDQRYPTAQALAEDLRRFLADEPTLARPIQWPDRVFRWARREPMGAAFALGCVLAGASIAATWVWYTLKVHAAAELAASFGREVTERDRGLRGELAAADLQLVLRDQAPQRKTDTAAALAKLASDRQAATALGSALEFARRFAVADGARTEQLPELTANWNAATFSPDGAAAVGLTKDGTLERVDLAEKRRRWGIVLSHALEGPIDWRWSPDGCRVALRSADGRVVVADRQGDVLLDRVIGGKGPERRRVDLAHEVSSTTADGSQAVLGHAIQIQQADVVLACGRHSRFLFLAIESGRGLVGIGPDGSETVLPSGREEFTDAVLFTDESAVLLLRRRGGVKVVDLGKDEVTLALPAPAAGEWRRLAADESNRWAAALDQSGGVAFWDLRTGKRWSGEPLREPGANTALRILADGKTLVHVSRVGRVAAWHVPTGRKFLDVATPASIFDARPIEQDYSVIIRRGRAEALILRRGFGD